MDTNSTEDEQYYNYAEEEEDREKRFFDSSNDNDESITGLSSASSCTDDANYDPSGQNQNHFSFDSYDFERSQNFIIDSHGGGDDDPSYYSEEEGSWADDYTDEDDSLGFPPGYITTLEEMQELSYSTNKIISIDNSSSSINGERKSFVNPSIIPSYFFCPLTETIMKDPVITPDGTTFERRSILRWLILQPCNPITGTPLSHVDLVDDHLVRTSIDKARKEAWVRYVVEFRDDDAEKVYEEKVVEKEKNVVETSLLLDEDLITGEEASEQLPVIQRGNDHPQAAPSTDDKVSISSATLNSAIDPGQRNHGWLVPLGVHKIVCSSPGLIVTTDVHRRSKVVKRRKLKKSLAGGKNIEEKKKKKKSIKKRIGNAVSPRKQRTEEEEYERRLNNIKITTTAVTEDLILPPGTHVEISETRIHGGRVRGKLCWEEEVTVELDADLVEEMKRQEEIVEMMAKLRVSPSKKKAFFRRSKHDKKEGGVGEDVAVAQTVPYSSNLSSNEISPPSSPRHQKKSRSPSPLTTIKYSGWISLQWAGVVGNFEKDEALKRRRKTINMLKEDKVDDYHPHLIADEDDGPWSRSLPLGVYHIDNDNSPVFETPEASSNPIGSLKSGDVVEVVETKVVMMKQRVNKSQGLSMLTSDFEGVRTVRARCMMSSDDNASKKRFKSGWITLSEEGKSETASPIPVGAHVVSSEEPLMSYSGTQIKSILPSGSCMEVDATRLEFDESETVKCVCGQESAYPVIAVKALISLGGYATLFTRPVGKSSQCSCGKELVTGQRHYANPVELGVYKIVQPDGVFLTEGIGPNTPIVTTLKQHACVEVVETRVEEGCVRGKINVHLSSDLSEMGQENAGWISLFEPPSFVWAEIVSEKR